MNLNMMKRSIAACLGLVAALAAFSVRAEGQIGFVDFDRVFAESHAGKQAKADLDNEAAGYKRELQKLNERLTSEQKNLDKNGITMSDADRALSERRIGDLKARIARKKRDYSEEWNQHRQDAQAALLGRIGKSVAKIAQQDHLEVVVNRAVAVAHSADITSQVIADLDRTKPAAAK